MTDLTEQWKKGELPEGHYYVKDGENMIAEYLDGYFYNNGEPMTSFSGGVDEVLAEVPDYVEWRNMVNCACEEHEANHRLLEENAQLKERVSKLEKMQYSYTPEEWNTMLRTVNHTKEKIERLEKQYDRAKWWLNEIVKNYRFTPISTAEKALKELSELEK